MRAVPFVFSAVTGGFRGNGAQSIEKIGKFLKGSLSVAALFVIVARDTKLIMVKPR